MRLAAPARHRTPIASVRLRVLVLIASVAACLPAVGAELRRLTFAAVGMFILGVVPATLFSKRPSAGRLLACSAMLITVLSLAAPTSPLWAPCFVVWFVAAIAALVQSHREYVHSRATTPPRDPGTRGWKLAAAMIVLVVVLSPIGLVVVERLPSPLPLQWLVARAGEFAIGDTFDFSDYVDTGRRFDVGDDVVMRVRASRPSYWRGTTYDRWDGRSWSRDPARFVQSVDLRGDLIGVLPPPEEPIPTEEQLVQQFELKKASPGTIYASYVPTEIRVPDGYVREDADGSMTTGSLGKGARYSVVSRRNVVTPDDLRASAHQQIPPRILQLYASQTRVVPRVETLAHEITAGQPTPYDQAVAIESWLRTNLEYNLDIPALLPGEDAVDRLLFEDREGYCQQFASAMVVMLRTHGIPARFVIGFTPGTFDPVAGVYEVRENDAHAWVEAYFPGQGWQQFDPTPEGNAPVGTKHDRSIGRFLQYFTDQVSRAPLAVKVGVPAVLLFGALEMLRRRWIRSRVIARNESWASKQLRRLETVGRKRGRPRAPDETVHEFAHALHTSVLSDPRVLEVADAIAADGYSQSGLDDAQRRKTDEDLASLSEGSGGSA